LPCREFIKLAVSGKKFARKRKARQQGSWPIKIRLHEIRAYSLVEFLAAIMVVIMIVVVIVVVIVVPIPVAACPRVFQIATAALRLAAVFTVLALRIMQLLLRIAEPLFALSVVIAIQRPRGNYPAQE
jgi:hypothetical protein